MTLPPIYRPVMGLYRDAPRALTAVPEGGGTEIATGDPRGKGTPMTRTNAFRIWLSAGLIAAVAATPALAAEGYESVTAITGGEASDRGSEVSSVNSITGAVQTSEDRGYESINAVTGPVADPPTTLASRPDGYSTPNALVGDQPAPPSSLVEVSEPSGFDWGDALVGALAGMALALLAFGAARLTGQSRSRTVESSA